MRKIGVIASRGENVKSKLRVKKGVYGDSKMMAKRRDFRVYI